MPDLTTHLGLPYLLAAQAQKHVTHNEALRLLDAMVQLSVLDRIRTVPPATPADGDRHLVATGATGAWLGWDLNIALWADGAWVRLVPRTGWIAWIADEAAALAFSGGAWVALGDTSEIADANFGLVNDADPSRRARFSLSAIAPGATRTYALPDASSELAILAGTQNFTGNKTFSGGLTVSSATALIGTATTAAAYGLGTGVTAAGQVKTLNLGTDGAAGSTTVVNVGSATAGAGGSTVINTPSVTFANAVSQVAMPQANLTAQSLGLGGATANATNRLSVNAPAVLLNNAGAGIEATVNKAAPANDASLAFKTGFSARALVGLTGDDDFHVKVSPDGSAFVDALRVDRLTAQVELAAPMILRALDALPPSPAAGRIALYGRSRAGAGWLDVRRPSGRDFPLQPHFGVNRIATWAPSTSSTINTSGMPRTAVGTASTPGLTTTSLSTSIRRWRMTSGVTASASAEERSASWVCWRGNAAGLGGFSYVNRLSLVTLQATGMGFFGLIGSISALSSSLTLSGVVNALGIGFESGTHANWQIVHNDATGAPTVIDLGGGFPLASPTSVVTVYIAAPPNGTEVGLRVVEEVSGATAEVTVSTDLPAAAQLLSPRSYLNNGSTAAAVAYDCSGVYVETDY